MSTLRNVAVVGFAQAPIVAHDEHRMAPEMLYPVVRRGAGAVRRRARRHRLPDRRLGRLHRRPALRLRRRARRHGHLAAAPGLAPRDGCRLRRLLRLDPHAGRRVRHGDGGRLRQGLGGRAGAHPQPAARSLLPRAARPRAADAPRRCRRAPTWRAAAPTDRDLAEIAARNRAAGARNPDAQVRDGGERRRAAAHAVGGRAAAPGLRAADRRERGLPDPRRRGQGREDVRRSRRGSAASTSAPRCRASARAT